MLKTITFSDLPAQVRQVLKEVGYGRDQYIVEQSGEPTAAIISMADFRLLQEVRQAQAVSSFPTDVVTVRHQYHENEDDDLAQLIEQARQVNAAIESGQMGTILHDDLKRMLLEKQA